jgi:sorbitol-specific phosphotransferase system component IIA
VRVVNQHFTRIGHVVVAFRSVEPRCHNVDKPLPIKG